MITLKWCSRLIKYTFLVQLSRIKLKPFGYWMIMFMPSLTEKIELEKKILVRKKFEIHRKGISKSKFDFFVSWDSGKEKKFSSEKESCSSILKFNNLRIAEKKWNGYKIIWKPVKTWRSENQIQKQK